MRHLMTTTKRPVGANDNETPNDNNETSGDDDPMHAIIAAMMDIRGSHDRSAFRELKEKCLSVEISLQERAACLLRLPQECSYVGDGLSTALKDYKAAYELIVELIDVTTAKDVCAVVSKHVDDDHFCPPQQNRATLQRMLVTFRWVVACMNLHCMPSPPICQSSNKCLRWCHFSNFIECSHGATYI